MIEVERRSTSSCKICGGATRMFDVVDISKSCNGQADDLLSQPVYYQRCIDCHFIFTRHFDDYSNDQWTSDIYNEEYYRSIDPDYADLRPRWNSLQIGTMLETRKRDIVGLDYGGGNGQTAERLRERDFVYDSYDPYGATRLTPGHEKRYNFCTAFEVAEHTPDPRGMMADIVRLASAGPLIVLIGTLVHDHAVDDPIRLNWWYAAPRNGHISLYSRKALAVLGTQFGLSLISFNQSQHVFFRGHAPSAIRRLVVLGKIRRRLGGLLLRRS